MEGKEGGYGGERDRGGDGGKGREARGGSDELAVARSAVTKPLLIAAV